MKLPVMTTNILNDNIYEQRFRDLFYDASLSAALLSGENFKVEMANAISLKLWGKDSSIIGKPLLEAIPEIKGQKVYEILKGVSASGNTYEGKEHSAQLEKDGVLTQVYVNLVYKPVKDQQGNVTSILAVGYDVTDQVLARKKSEESDTRAKLAIECAGLGTFELEFKTGNTTTSSRFDDIFGFDHPVAHSEYISRIHPDDVSLRNAAQTKALETGGLRYDARIILPDNSIRWVKINGSIIFDEHGLPQLLIGTALDITEETISLQKLQESEERYRTLITETPEVGAGLYVGRELRIRYVNDVMLEFWGKDKTVIGKILSEAIPELKDQPFMEQLDEVFVTGKEFTAKEEKALLRRNGTLQVSYYNYTYKALRDTNGKIFGIHNMAIDVTEQVQNKLNLIESEESIRRLFEQTPVGLAKFKGKSLIVEIVNETILTYWGRTREAVINKSVWEALPELVDQGIKKIAERVFETGVPYSSQETSVAIRRNGKMETIFIRFGFQALKDWHGQIIGLLAIANEITDMVDARHKIERNEARLKFLADSMPQVVWIANVHGTVTYYNKRVQEFAGVKQNEDGSWVWEGIVHDDDLRQTSVAWTTSVKNGSPYQMEHRIKMQDGNYRWHLSRAYLYDTDDGVQWYGTATDVHNQKVLEMNLESAVKDRTLELQRSNDDLQQFAHVASHDLKEPLRKIKTFSFKLQDEFGNILNERGNSLLNKVISSSDRMFSMINGVLNYASISAAGTNSQRVDVNDVIRAVEIDLELLLQEKQGIINFANLPSIAGHPDLVYQLFYNLLNNSLKFARANTPVDINILAHRVQINGHSYVEITIRDNGIGFKNDYAEHIFGSFNRLHSKDKYEGSGLGLAMCQRIVESHGGTITATGIEGVGATFKFTLPS